MGPMRKSRLSRYKQDRLIERFVAGTTARTASSLCGVNRKTAAFYFLRLREIIAVELEAESEAMFGGEIEVDESYFAVVEQEHRICPTGDTVVLALTPHASLKLETLCWGKQTGADHRHN